MERETGRGIARNAQRYRYPTCLSLSVVADSAKAGETPLDGPPFRQLRHSQPPVSPLGETPQ